MAELSVKVEDENAKEEAKLAAKTEAKMAKKDDYNKAEKDAKKAEAIKAAEEAFDKADVIVQGVYRPAAIEHVPLETQVALVVDGQRYTSTTTIGRIDNTAQLSIGAKAGSGGDWYKGRMDEVSLTIG